MGNQRQIWGKKFELAVCEQCGEPVATCEEMELLAKRGAFIHDPVILCTKCRRKAAASAF